MKIYLDDTRPAPEGWHLVYTPEEAIAFLERGLVREISLDHDLGLDHDRTGYAVLVWIEKQVYSEPKFYPPIIHLHTMNPIGRKRMEAALTQIHSRLKQTGKM